MCKKENFSYDDYPFAATTIAVQIVKPYSTQVLKRMFLCPFAKTFLQCISCATSPYDVCSCFTSTPY